MQYGPFYDRSTAGTFTQLKSEVFTGVRYNAGSPEKAAPEIREKLRHRLLASIDPEEFPEKKRC
jgi:hypothetical protein